MNETSDSSSTPSTPSAGSEEKAPFNAGQFLRQLQSEFKAMRDYLPLTIGVDRIIAERFPDISRKQIRAAMRLYTQSTRYFKNFERNTNRFNLDGSTAEELTEEHRAYAKEVLKSRSPAKKHKNRKTENQSKKLEKLKKLVSHFNAE